MTLKKSWLPALVITAVCLGILWTTCPICFQNNDDKTLMYLVSGFATGSPEAGTVFGSFYYYGFISLLYRIYGGIAWYTIIELAVVAASLWIICDSLMDATEKVGKYAGTLIFILLFLFCFLHFSTALQYTATAGLAAGAAVASLVSSQSKANIKNCQFIISVIMLVVAYGIRKQFGLVGLSAALIVLFFEFFGEDKKLTIKRAIIVIAAMALAFCSNAIYEKVTGISEFNDYYAQAGTWIDYPHMQYADGGQLYESVGWDETLYDAAEHWFFMDENLTKDNFKVLVDAYDGNKVSLRDCYDRAHNLMQSSMIVNGQMVTWLVLLLGVNIMVLVKGLPKRQLLAIDGLFAMFAVVSVYFLIEGRFPMRAYQALVFIYMVPSVVMMANLLGKLERKKNMHAAIICLALVPVLCIRFKPETNITEYTYTVAHDIYRTADIEKSTALEKYAMVHPDSMYIYDLDLALPAGPFTVYKEQKPKNLVFWGGWVYNTPMYWTQVHANGFDTLYSKDFFEDNVYFCSVAVPETPGEDVAKADWSAPTFLIKYMQTRYPEATVEVVDEFDGMYVYRFNK